MSKQRDESGLRSLRPSRGQNGGSMESHTASNDGKMSESAFVTGNRPARWKVHEILRQSPDPLTTERAGDKADIMGDLEPPDIFPRVLFQQSGFGSADGQGYRGFNR